MSKIEAVIFDMDGVIIDSEPLWKLAEHKVFSSVGVKLTDELCEKTAALTTEAVTRFWYDRFPWEGKSLPEVENEVVDYVELLIHSEGLPIRGIEKTVCRLKEKGLKIGLATNSPERLIRPILDKIGITEFFDIYCSAEDELQGKPAPDVYLTAAQKLGVSAENCLVIEDSSTGLKAAKSAGMKTVALLPPEANPEKYKLADFVISTFDELDYSMF